MNGHIIYPTKFSTDINQFQEVAENPNLSKTDLRVFMFLCCRMGSQHFMKIDKGAVADSLVISKKKVSDSLFTLEGNGVIVSGGDDHTKDGYKMNYTYK